MPTEVASPGASALAVPTYCEVCEEPAVGLVAGRWHPVMLCPVCLGTEPDIHAAEEAEGEP